MGLEWDYLILVLLDACIVEVSTRRLWFDCLDIVFEECKFFTICRYISMLQAELFLTVHMLCIKDIANRDERGSARRVVY